MSTRIACALLCLSVVSCYEYPLTAPVQLAFPRGQKMHPLLVATGQKSAAGVCVDYTIEGYYLNTVLQKGPLPSGFVNRPAGMTPCQLSQLHRDCVDRINLYRTGALKFSDGTTDPRVVAGLYPYMMHNGTNECSSEAAMGDLVDNYAGGGGACTGAHDNAFVCPGGAMAQNSCCARGSARNPLNTYDTVKNQLFSCLQQMWDEGETSNKGEKGHWQNMRNNYLQYVSCGFAWSSEGKVMMTQDFFANNSPCNPTCTTCGASDGCSGNPCSCTEETQVTQATTQTANAQSSDNSNQDSSFFSTTPIAVAAGVAGAVFCISFFIWRVRARVSRRRVVVAVKDEEAYVAAPRS